ncbi:MAG: CRR6 family NdhI maturation factor [Microcoleaceae cyanobacterium]
MPTVKLDVTTLNTLDLSPVQGLIEQWLENGEIATYEQQIQLEIDYPRDPQDPRELSEIPEIRLWFVRLDTCYPWLPFLLDWKSGELVRYAAMLVPHQFHRTEGIQYNPEALEIFLMHKIFALTTWMKSQQLPSQSRLKSMAQMLGYDLEDEFFALIAQP